MPTPSNNGPDPQSPRAYPFSTCPDPDEQNSPQQQQTQQQTQRAHTPSSWRAHPPPAPMEVDTAASRSPTMSPHPQSGGSPDRDRGEPDGMVTTPGDTDDSQKPTDTDEDMLVGDAVGGSGAGDGGGDGGGRGGRRGGIPVGVRPVSESDIIQDGVSARRTGRRSTGAAESSSRRRQAPDMVSPASIEVDPMDGGELAIGGPPWVEDTGLLGMGYEYADTRVIPVSPSSYLRPGSRFHGTQQSERQRYDVQVEIKHVDLRESFLCGYLRIQG